MLLQVRGRRERSAVVEERRRRVRLLLLWGRLGLVALWRHAPLLWGWLLLVRVGRLLLHRVAADGLLRWLLLHTVADGRDAPLLLLLGRRLLVVLERRRRRWRRRCTRVAILPLLLLLLLWLRLLLLLLLRWRRRRPLSLLHLEPNKPTAAPIEHARARQRRPTPMRMRGVQRRRCVLAGLRRGRDTRRRRRRDARPEARVRRRDGRPRARRRGWRLLALLLLLLRRRHLLWDRSETRCRPDARSGPTEIDGFVHPRALRVPAACTRGGASV